MDGGMRCCAAEQEQEQQSRESVHRSERSDDDMTMDGAVDVDGTNHGARRSSFGSPLVSATRALAPSLPLVLPTLAGRCDHQPTISGPWAYLHVSTEIRTAS